MKKKDLLARIESLEGSIDLLWDAQERAVDTIKELAKLLKEMNDK